EPRRRGFRAAHLPSSTHLGARGLTAHPRPPGGKYPCLFALYFYHSPVAANIRAMNLDLPAILAQTALLLLLAPLLTGLIRNWKAKLQNRRGPRLWQPFFDILKFLRKEMVISEHTSWVFSFTPYVLFLTTLSAGLLVPMISAQAPLSLFGGV